jgi:hypothetical protein
MKTKKENGRLTATLDINEYMEGSIRERIEERLVNLIAEKIGKRMDEVIGARILELADKEWNKSAKAKVDEFFSKPCRKTNNYGEETGGSITMRELLIERFDKYLTAKVNNRGEESYNGDTTRAQRMLDDLIKKPLQDAVTETVKKIADKAREQVQASVSRYIAEQLSPTISAPQLKQ